MKVFKGCTKTPGCVLCRSRSGRKRRRVQDTAVATKRDGNPLPNQSRSV